MYKLYEPTLEDWLDFWIEELVQKEYILKVIPAKDATPFVLFDKIDFSNNIKKEDNTYKIKKKTLLEKVTYTSDRTIIWSKKAENIFYVPFENYTHNKNNLLLAHKHNDLNFSYLELKAPPGYGGRNSSDASFRINQKWVFEKYSMYVNKVYLYPTGSGYDKNLYLWLNTFTPKRYFTTDKLTKFRSIKKWTPITLEQYLNLRTHE